MTTLLIIAGIAAYLLLNALAGAIQGVISALVIYRRYRRSLDK